MPDPALTLLAEPLPNLPGGTLLLALTGWMDGGLVSTGTVRQLMESRTLREIARIEPEGFYIDNFPGSMEISAIFRPEVKYEGGLITRFDLTTNVFHADTAPEAAGSGAGGMLFFVGKEPNINWQGFARCIFDVIARCGVRRVVFIGSFGGTVPHTREPRLFGSVSSAGLLPLLERYAIKPSDYEGPASFASYLLHVAPTLGLEMISISAEIPGYLQGHNPLSIEAVTRRLAAILSLDVDFASLRSASTEWELKVSEAVDQDAEMAERVKKLEENYDNQLIGEEES